MVFGRRHGQRAAGVNSIGRDVRNRRNAQEMKNSGNEAREYLKTKDITFF